MLSQNNTKNAGFTLIEMMMVILVIGIMASMVQFNFNTTRPDEKLKLASERFASVFDTAAEYGLLNNIELGVVITDNSYQFLGYDGVRWSDVPDQDLLALYTLPEGLEMSLSLDDLPIEEPLLFDVKSYIEQQKEADLGLSTDKDQGNKSKNSNAPNEENNDDDNSYDEDNQLADRPKKKRIPQIYVFSGGDISAFSLTFSLQEQVADELDYDVNKVYRVLGLYSTPLKIEALGFGDADQ